MVDTASKTGFISQIIGPVLDIEFPNGELPKVYNALVITDGDSSVTCEVQQLLGNNKVRGVALLGTSLSDAHREYLMQFSTIIVALDPDALSKTLSIASELRAYKQNVKVLKLIDDLKYCNETDFINLNKLIGDR